MTRPYVSIRLAKKANSLLVCSATGCTEHRDKVSKYCSKHYDHSSMYGHPLVKALSKKTYAVEKAQVRQFIEQHLDHIGINQALLLIDRWLKEPKGSPKVKQHIQRLADAGIKPIDVLAESSAIWLLQRLQPKYFPNGDVLTMATGHGIIHLAPLHGYYVYSNGVQEKRYPRLTGKTKKEIGHFITTTLRLLFVNITSSIEASMKAEEDQKLNFLKPFDKQ